MSPIFCNECGEYNMEGDDDHIHRHQVDALKKKIEILEGRFVALKNAYSHTLEQMTDINAHMGYQFTQIVMSHKDKFRELIK
jgi:hypothetical protein